MARDVGVARREASHRSVDSRRPSEPNRRRPQAPPVENNALDAPRLNRVEDSDLEQFSSTDSENEQVYSDEEEGAELYRQFLENRFRQNNLQPANVANRIQAPLHSDLASLAERFTRSQGREQVRQKAEELDLSELSAENFNSLLSELFHDGGVTQERLLVLFFFCSDLTIRACRAGLEALCERITSWTLSFIKSTVLLWVRVHGGWGRVLRGTASCTDSMLMVGSALALLAILFVAFKKT